MPEHPGDLKTGHVLQDDLRPLSCTGTNSQGGLSLTLIDALDTLVVGCWPCNRYLSSLADFAELTAHALP